MPQKDIMLFIGSKSAEFPALKKLMQPVLGDRTQQLSAIQVYYYTPNPLRARIDLR